MTILVVGQLVPPQFPMPLIVSVPSSFDVLNFHIPSDRYNSVSHSASTSPSLPLLVHCYKTRTRTSEHYKISRTIVPCSSPPCSLTCTTYSCPGIKSLGTLTEQGRIHCPFTSASQVPWGTIRWGLFDFKWWAILYRFHRPCCSRCRLMPQHLDAPK